MLKVLKKLLDFIFYLIVILIFLALLTVLGYTIYFRSNQTKVIEGYPGMGDVRIEFDRVNTDIFENYPYGNLSLENFKVIDASDSENNKSIVAVKELSVDFKNYNWEDKRLLIRDIKLNSGEIYIHQDSLGHFNFNFNEIFNPESSSNSSSGNGWSLNTDSLYVDLKDILVSYVADDKYKSVITSVKSGTADIYQNADGNRRISSLLDLSIIDFTFNQENGTFLNNANVNGPIDLLINQDGMHISQTTLSVNNQKILASAEFYNDKDKNSYIHLINKNTDFEDIKLLLSPKLQTTLDPFKAEGLFAADATITLMPPYKPRVDIDFAFPDNNIYIRNQVFYSTKASGHFVNDNIYDRTYKKVINDKKYVRFDITSAETINKGANIHLNNAIILAKKGHLATITSDAKIDGPSALISDQLENDEFIFNGGTFNIDAMLKGQIDNLQNIIQASEFDLTIDKCIVQYLPSEVVLPIQTLQLNKKAGDGDFIVTGLTADQEYGLTLDGTITNIMDIINGKEDNQSVTNANLKATRLSWEDIVDILGEGFFDNLKLNKTPFEKRRAMKKTLRGFKDLFQPNIYIEIDSSGYYDYVSMENIVAHMHFPEKNIVTIDSGAFDLEEGRFEFSCNYDISSDDVTPFEIYCNAVDINLSKLVPAFDYFGVDAIRDLEFLPKDFDIKMRLNGVIDDSTGIVKKSLTGDIVFNSTERRVEYAHISFDRKERFDSLENMMVPDLFTAIEIKGNPLVFNSYLNNDQFFFNEGDFELNANYAGSTFSLDDIIANGELSLTIDSSFVFCEPLSISFPLTNIDLSVKKNSAKYSILLESESLNQEIKFDGSLQNISQIIVEDTGLPVLTTSNIYSPRITWKNFIDIFNIGPSETFVPAEIVEVSTKTSTGAFCDLLYRFSPDIKMRFDTLEYSNEFCVHNFSTQLSLVDSIFYVSDAQFDYRDSDILLNSALHLSDEIDSIDVMLNAINVDLKNLSSDIEELTQEDFDSFDYMSGTIDIDAKISQHYKGDFYVSDTMMNADVNFTINNLIIDEAPYMEKIGSKFRQPERFRTVKFAPISNHVTYINDSLYVPLVELQSTAFDVFVEGHYHNDHPNIWLSIPLFNLKKRDTSVAPEKEGYARRRMKFHIEYGHHKKPDPNFKLRTSKRKFYKQRGLLNKWKKRKNDKDD